jgi:hypothetical protein
VAEVTAPVERQAWPVGRSETGRVAITNPAWGDLLAVVGHGAGGWTCVGFAFTDADRDRMLAGANYAYQVPVDTDGTPARWAIMVRRA